MHGSGRLFGRNEAKRRFTRSETDAWLRDRGVELIGCDLDESPMAYRRLPELIARFLGLAAPTLASRLPAGHYLSDFHRLIAPALLGAIAGGPTGDIRSATFNFGGVSV